MHASNRAHSIVDLEANRRHVQRPTAAASMQLNGTSGRSERGFGNSDNRDLCTESIVQPCSQSLLAMVIKPYVAIDNEDIWSRWQLSQYCLNAWKFTFIELARSVLFDFCDGNSASRQWRGVCPIANRDGSGDRSRVTVADVDASNCGEFRD